MAEGPEHLKAHQWQPGQSGNPKGRPKRVSFEALIAQILDEELPGADMKKREALARVFVDMMLKRNAQLIKEYLAREWSVVQKHELSGDSGGPIEVAGPDVWASFARSLPRIEDGKKASRGNGSNGSRGAGNGSS